ncbi:MAG: glycosyltransferase [Nanoarchaeota archaeon]
MKIKISFVILSYNDSDMAINAIQSIKKLKTKYKYDIFVVDNGSIGGAKSIKNKFKDVKVIELKENAGTAAYDYAIKKSDAKYIYFTGCDIEAKEDMLDKLVHFLEKNNDAVQAAPKYISIYDKKTIDLAGTWLSRSFYSGTFKDNTLGSKPAEIPYIGTGLIRKDFIDRWGYLFDNDYFFYGEDVDLGLRIRLMGYKVYYIPDSIVYHAGSMSRRVHKPSYLTFLMERNLMRTFYQTMSVKSIMKFKIYGLLMRIIAIIKDILTLNIGNAFARLKAILWMIFNIVKVFRKRNEVQKMRKVKDEELLKHFSEKHLWSRII